MHWKCTSETCTGLFLNGVFWKKWERFDFITWTLASKYPIKRMIRSLIYATTKTWAEIVTLWCVNKVNLKEIYFYLENHHFKFQLNPSQLVFCAVGHKLQCLLPMLFSQGTLVLMWALKCERTTGHQSRTLQLPPTQHQFGADNSLTGRKKNPQDREL